MARRRRLPQRQRKKEDKKHREAHRIYSQSPILAFSAKLFLLFSQGIRPRRFERARSPETSLACLPAGLPACRPACLPATLPRPPQEK